MKYEYMVVRFSSINNFSAELDRKSRAGWRLHSFQECRKFSDVLAVFERERVDPDTDFSADFAESLRDS